MFSYYLFWSRYGVLPPSLQDENKAGKSGDAEKISKGDGQIPAIENEQKLMDEIKK